MSTVPRGYYLGDTVTEATVIWDAHGAAASKNSNANRVALGPVLLKNGTEIVAGSPQFISRVGSAARLTRQHLRFRAARLHLERVVPSRGEPVGDARVQHSRIEGLGIAGHEISDHGGAGGDPREIRLRVLIPKPAGIVNPIVALTAHAMAEDRARTSAAGCDDHLTKPLNQAEVIATLVRHLQPRSRGRG